VVIIGAHLVCIAPDLFRRNRLFRILGASQARSACNGMKDNPLKVKRGREGVNAN
jgi:hypothetical protein